MGQGIACIDDGVASCRTGVLLQEAFVLLTGVYAPCITRQR